MATALRDPRVDALRALGLTEYQARAYAALARLGPTTATRLARAAGVPRNKLYPTLEELSALDLAETRLGEVQTFAPRPIGNLLQARVREHRDLASRLEEQHAELAGLFPLRDADAEPGQAHRVVHGRAASVDQLAKAVERAEAEVLAVAGAAAADLLAGKALLEPLRERAAAGLAVRVVLPPDRAAEEPVRRLGEALPGLVRVADRPLGDAAVLVADGQRSVRVEGAGGAEVCIVSEAAVVAQLLARAADSLWTLARPVPLDGAPLPAIARPALSYADFAPEVRRGLAGARQRVDACISADFAAVAVRHFLEPARDAARRGVLVRVLAPPSPALAPLLPAMLDAGAEVRLLPGPPVAGYGLFDRSLAVVGVAPPEFQGQPWEPFAGIVVHDASTVASMAEAFDAEWARCQEPGLAARALGRVAAAVGTRLDGA